jgi:hypothetical protein
MPSNDVFSFMHVQIRTDLIADDTAAYKCGVAFARKALLRGVLLIKARRS